MADRPLIVLDTLYRRDRRETAGSTLRIQTPRTLSFDGGPGWTGIVCREGSRAVAGATVGLRPGETIRKGTLPDVDDYAAWLPYYGRVLDQGEKLWDLAWPNERAVRVVLEGVHRPESHHNGRRTRIPDAEWLPCVSLVAAAVGRFGRVYVVPPQHLGERHQRGNGGTGHAEDYYDDPLHGTSAFPNDHPKRVTNHTQAAFDGAGVAELELQAARQAERVAA